MTDLHVVAAIIQKDGKVLVARRTDAEKGGWEFPGGKVERGESAVQALERELQEELACEVASAWPYDTVRHDLDGSTLTMDCLICRLSDGAAPTIADSTHSELRWVSREELGELAWMPADAGVARSIAYYWDEAFSDQLL